MTISAVKNCGAEGCDARATRRGFCHVHYDRARSGGAMTLKEGAVRPIFTHVQCRMSGCENRAVSSKLCQYHYNKLRRVGELREADGSVVVTFHREPCSVDGCAEKANHKGLCLNHYRHLRIHGDPLAGERRDGRSKEWHVGHHGYVVKYCGGEVGFVLQHRHIMGEHIGRQLHKEENVHHKNGDRTDNRIENLELWSKSQPSGQRVKDKVAWAKQILAEYGDLDV